MTVHFIGAGPGAADLLTVRASRILGRAEMCLYPGTYVGADVLGLCAPGAELIDTQALNLDEIVEHCARGHRAGFEVARLCSGDPSVYSALREQADRLAAVQVPWQVVPGVAAYAAAAAAVGAELTVPELAQSVVLTRAWRRSTAMPTAEALANFAATGATLVLHLAITFASELAATLIPHYGADCPVVVAYRVSQPAELVIRTSLQHLAAEVADAALREAAVILVGRALDVGSPAQSFLYDPRRERGSAKSGRPNSH